MNSQYENGSSRRLSMDELMRMNAPIPRSASQDEVLKKLESMNTELTDTLREEMSSALEERKTEALRLGELAGTRLLFPMLMMLGVVIISLVIPAFISF